MHPDKAEALNKLAEVTQELDLEIGQLKDVALHPHREGWGKSLRALSILPFLGLSATICDATDMLFRRIPDPRWGDAPEDGSAAPPDGQSR